MTSVKPPFDASKTVTIWAWLLSIAPLTALIALVLVAINILGGSANASDTSSALGGTVVAIVGDILFVCFAILDWVELKRLGVARPFGWGFAFLGWISSLTTLVYVIGRAVRIRREVGRGGSGPLVLFVVLAAILFATGIALVIYVSANLVGQAGHGFGG